MIKGFRTSCFIMVGLFLGFFANLNAESLKCQTPILLIKTPEIRILDNNLGITQEEVQNFLNQIIQKDSCLAVRESPMASILKINVQSSIDVQKEESIASIEQESIANIKVSFILKREHASSQFSSEQSLKVSGKKFLGIGKGAEISHEDSQVLLQKAIQKAYEQMLGTLR